MSEIQSLYKHMQDIEGLLCEPIRNNIIDKTRKMFLQGLAQATRKDALNYLEIIQNLPPALSTKGIKWLQGIVDYYCQKASSVLSSFGLFRKP